MSETTSSGLSFCLPPYFRLKAHSPKAGARAILLAPTRELALQTHKAVRELCKYTDLRTAVLVGGDAMEARPQQLADSDPPRNPDHDPGSDQPQGVAQHHRRHRVPRRAQRSAHTDLARPPGDGI